MVSDSDSVDTEGYFTSFRNECGFPKAKKGTKEDDKEPVSMTTTENEYELFGKGSTSTTASSCGTVVLRNKPDPPVRTSSVEHLIDKQAQSVSQSPIHFHIRHNKLEGEASKWAEVLFPLFSKDFDSYLEKTGRCLVACHKI